MFVSYISQNQTDNHSSARNAYRVGIQLEPEYESLRKALAAPQGQHHSTWEKRQKILEHRARHSQVRKSAEKEAQAPTAPAKGTGLKLGWWQRWKPVPKESCSPFHSVGLSVGGGCPDRTTFPSTPCIMGPRDDTPSHSQGS